MMPTMLMLTMAEKGGRRERKGGGSGTAMAQSLRLVTSVLVTRILPRILPMARRRVPVSLCPNAGTTVTNQLCGFGKPLASASPNVNSVILAKVPSFLVLHKLQYGSDSFSLKFKSILFTLRAYNGGVTIFN